jgi:hypothetical protein
MNTWDSVIGISAALGVAAGFFNFILLLSIRVAIAEQANTLKDWARAEFSDKSETERRMGALERAQRMHQPHGQD